MEEKPNAHFVIHSHLLYNIVNGLNKVHRDHPGKSLFATNLFILNLLRFSSNVVFSSAPVRLKFAYSTFAFPPAVFLDMMTENDEPLIEYASTCKESNKTSYTRPNPEFAFNITMAACGLLIFVF